MRFDAAIFDMDGLLLESESLWRVAEQDAATRLGLPLTNADFDQTMGMRMHDVAQHWYDTLGWEDGPAPDVVADEIIDRVIELVANREPLPGVLASLDIAAHAGLRIALCSSSDDRLIEAALGALGIGDRFELTHSAQHNEYGKPHPEPYLSTAAKLGVDPRACLVFEDSMAGCVSAKAAGMSVVAVPDPAVAGSGRFGFADVVLGSLTEFDQRLLSDLADGTPLPNMSRPRFHLAFPVDNLADARSFYGEILGCAEGRSAETWADFNLWGHQIVAHVGPEAQRPATNAVDGKQVPASHFGVLLHLGAWRSLVDRLKATNVPFVIDPYVRFEGEPGEQHTFFVTDPAGNALEFKAFADDRIVFAA